jgi:hypothetical protein
MKLLFFLFSLVNATYALEQLFKDWTIKYGKEYTTNLEYRYRFSVFAENWANIPLNTHYLTMNSFADLTNEEFYSYTK